VGPADGRSVTIWDTNSSHRKLRKSFLYAGAYDLMFSSEHGVLCQKSSRVTSAAYGISDVIRPQAGAIVANTVPDWNHSSTSFVHEPRQILVGFECIDVLELPALQSGYLYCGNDSRPRGVFETRLQYITHAICWQNDPEDF